METFRKILTINRKLHSTYLDLILLPVSVHHPKLGVVLLVSMDEDVQQFGIGHDQLILLQKFDLLLVSGRSY